MYARLKVSIYIIMCVLDHHYCTHYTLPLHKLYRIICMSCDNIYVFFPQRIDAVALIVRRSIVSYAFRFDDVSCSLAGSRRLAICGTWTRLVGATTATVNSRHADAFSDWKSQMRQVPERIIIFHLPQHFFFLIWFCRSCFTDCQRTKLCKIVQCCSGILWRWSQRVILMCGACVSHVR